MASRLGVLLRPGHEARFVDAVCIGGVEMIEHLMEATDITALQPTCLRCVSGSG